MTASRPVVVLSGGSKSGRAGSLSRNGLLQLTGDLDAELGDRFEFVARPSSAAAFIVIPESSDAPRRDTLSAAPRAKVRKIVAFLLQTAKRPDLVRALGIVFVTGDKRVAKFV